MSRLQAIQNELVSINETVFQDLCDCFLKLENENYKMFTRSGSQVGKQKTKKGTPDSFALLPDGKYIFIEYSTNITEGINKLIEDVQKCLNPSKTGINVEDIAEIILCFNFNLKAEEVQKLRELLPSTAIKLTIYNLDDLSLELHLQHRNLVQEYLGLPLDTGQIVSIDRFVSEYNGASRGLATPLDNLFFHREDEVRELMNLIANDNFIVLTGAPGVGKTKLALETIKRFTEENSSYKAFCVSYKNTTLVHDLSTHLILSKNYILFVDDANRIDALNQIIGYYMSERTGKLKIILTVRDYAVNSIAKLCMDILPARYSINKLTDKQLVDIVKVPPFEILNSKYQKDITRIANGNPRLAIMAARIANEKQSLYALSDVSDLFETYFTTFIRDDEEFADDLSIKILGLIAFFHTLPYSDKNVMVPVLDNFGIEYSSFIDRIDTLDKLELVELGFEYVKIPEQNLSTFFFYKAFIKDALLSFEVLLNNYFNKNSKRFTDCVISANNTFGYQNVIEKIQPMLKNYLNLVKHDEDNGIKFLSIFWFYLQDETLELLYNDINALPIADTSEYQVKYETNAFLYNQDNVIELLGKLFCYQTNLRDALELSFEYVRRLPQHLPELIHKIKEVLSFHIDDFDYGLARQKCLYKILIDGLNQKDALVSKCFFELSKTFMQFRFEQTECDKNNTFTIHHFSLPDDQYVRDFRKVIWYGLANNFCEDAFEALEAYTDSRPDIVPELLQYDISFVEDIIIKQLYPNDFRHCRFVHRILRLCRNHNIDILCYESFKSRFTNHLYEMYLKINWDRYRDKESYEFEDYSEYEKLKEDDIRRSFVFKNEHDIKSFYNDFIYLAKVVEEQHQWYNANVLDLIVDENCNINFKFGLEVLKVILNDNLKGYVPRIIFRNHLASEDRVDAIWNLLQDTTNLESKPQWELAFYAYVNDSFIGEKYLDAIRNTVADMNCKCIFNYEGIRRFTEIDITLLEDVIRIAVNRNERENGILFICEEIIDNYLEKVNCDITLIEKAYIQQATAQKHFDYNDKILLKILPKDNSFLMNYVDALSKKSDFFSIRKNRELGVVWHIDNIELVLKNVFDFFAKKEPFFCISEHFCNSFFYNLPDIAKARAADFLLSYANDNYMDSNKLNILLDIARHSMHGLFDRILLQYINTTQDVKLFESIWWVQPGGVYHGDVIIGDIKAAQWRNVLSSVEQSNMGIRLIPIKRYINSEIESSLRYAEFEKKRRFIEDK